MKRILSLLLTLALLLPCLAACESGGTPSASDGTTTSKPAQNADHEEAVEADYSDFEMPEETDTLVLYTAGMLTMTMTPAVELFKSLYPEVNVEWYKLGEDEMETRIRAEIPAGKGPDLLFDSSITLPDIYKTMSAKLFEDLNPYAACDEEFCLDDYIAGIINEGVFQGKRYLFPVAHLPTLLTTSKELLTETGITLDDLASFDEFVDACTRFYNAYPESNIFIDTGPYDLDNLNFQNLYGMCGFRAIDYENSAVILDEAKFRKIVDLCKLYSGNDPNKEKDLDGEYALSGAILKRECLFSTFAGTPHLMKQEQTYLKLGGETAVFLMSPAIDGGKTTMISRFAAIPALSSNKLNAWRMLKILLSDEIQSNPDALKAVYPVRIESVSQFLMYSYYDGYSSLKASGLEDLLLDYDHAYCKSRVLTRYVRDEMMPYIQGQKSFEDCYKKLMNTLELYKDE